MTDYYYTYRPITHPMAGEKRKRLFVSGPMTGLPEMNYPAFHAAAARLRADGYHVENPAENPRQESWESYLRMSLRQLLSCDSVYLLPGWENSKGARLEVLIARGLGLEIVETA